MLLIFYVDFFGNKLKIDTQQIIQEKTFDNIIRYKLSLEEDK